MHEYRCLGVGPNAAHFISLNHREKPGWLNIISPGHHFKVGHVYHF